MHLDGGSKKAVIKRSITVYLLSIDLCRCIDDCEKQVKKNVHFSLSFSVVDHSFLKLQIESNFFVALLKEH